MSALAHLVQIAILLGAAGGVTALGVGTAVVDHRHKRARHLAAIARICDVCAGTGDSTGADWCEECSGTGREIVDNGWDDARDRWIDGQLGVA